MAEGFSKDSPDHPEGDETADRPLQGVRELIGDAVVKYCGDEDRPGADDLFTRALENDPAGARSIMTEIADAIGEHAPDDPLVRDLRRKTGQ